MRLEPTPIPFTYEDITGVIVGPDCGRPGFPGPICRKGGDDDDTLCSPDWMDLTVCRPNFITHLVLGTRLTAKDQLEMLERIRQALRPDIKLALWASNEGCFKQLKEALGANEQS
jgi:hypothetical protein